MKFTSEILTIKSDRSELKTVERFLHDFFEKNCVSDKYFNKVMLCVSEAIINSIDHGNQNDAGKCVSLEISRVNDFFEFSICDEGEGFDFHKVEDPTKAENLKKEKGRGIHIIKSLTNELEYKNKGNCVKFKLYLGE